MEAHDDTVLGRHTHLFAILKCIARDREAIEIVLTGDENVLLTEAVCVRLRSRTNAPTVEEVAGLMRVFSPLFNNRILQCMCSC